MAIDQTKAEDVKVAVAFTDDLRAAYLQLASMQAKIARYGAAAAAVAMETATPREAAFAEIVQLLVSAEDLGRIAVLSGEINTFVGLLEADYSDLIQS